MTETSRIVRLATGAMLALAACAALAQEPVRKATPSSAGASGTPTLPPPALVLPPPLPAPSPAQAGAVPGAPQQAASDAAAGATRSRAFLSREEIEATRSRCKVSLAGGAQVRLPAFEAEQTIRLDGGQGCLKAVSADVSWLDIRTSGSDELLLIAQDNDDAAPRRGEVTVVTPNRTFVLFVRQAGSGG